MFRRIFTLLTAVAFATSTLAGSKADDVEAAKDTLWTAITNTDYAEVEAQIGNAHEHYLKTGEDQDRTRALLGLFYANNPMLDEFVEGWLSVYPVSPYANTAQAWLYHKRSWDIRGEGPAHDIYPWALSEFGRLQLKAWTHAERAFEESDRLLSASDAILRLAPPNDTLERAYEILDQVMQSDPNMGTLRRAIYLTAPGWGRSGTWEQAQKICEYYGPMITDHNTDPVTYCKLYAGGTYHPAYERRGWLFDAVTSGDYPDLEHFPMWSYTSPHASRAQVEFARTYLSRDDVIDTDNAYEFDRNVAERYGFDFVGEMHQRRALEEAREAILRDPYNPEVLDVLLDSIWTQRKVGSRSNRKLVYAPTIEERKEYTRRLLVASPYTARRWLAYGSAHFPRAHDTLLLDDPMRINAIVYSDHAPGYLYGYALHKWQLLATLEQLEQETQSKAFQDLDDESKSKTRGEIQRWLAVRATLNLDEEFRCPMMRAYRLFQLVCEHSTSANCEDNPQYTEMFEIVRDDVNARRVCTGVMSVPAHELFYTPIPVDLSAPEG